MSRLPERAQYNVIFPQTSETMKGDYMSAQIFHRAGWDVEQISGDTFSCTYETRSLNPIELNSSNLSGSINVSRR